MPYYRFSNDRRLLFATTTVAGQEKSGYKTEDMDDQNIPQSPGNAYRSLLAQSIDLTFSRLPHVGRISPKVFFAHGFGGHGHGIITANIMGKILPRPSAARPNASMSLRRSNITLWTFQTPALRAWRDVGQDKRAV